MFGCGGPTTAPTAPTAPVLELADGVVLEPLEPARAGELLGREDSFIRALSPLDRRIRLGSAEPVTTARFLATARASALPWTDDELAMLGAAATAVRRALAELGGDLGLPPRIPVIKTTGREEIPGSAYTRGTSIIFTEGALEASGRLLAHELFHVLSRARPELRDRLYAIIGFRPVPPVRLPAGLDARRVTNPDAPSIAHGITVTFGGREVLAAPILLTRPWQPGATLFDVLEPRLIALDDRGRPRLQDGAAVLIEYAEAGGFFEQVGRNTQYIIHPEEILAVNFSLLLLGSSEATPSPGIPRRLREELLR